MKVLGITAEYNPFHNGHKYHLEKSLEITGADYSVAVMSGNFTQRGEATILDKWTRSRLAVENGIDLVVELPFVFACSRAESFAKGAVDILSGMGVTHISFGSESGDLKKLQSMAEALGSHEEQISKRRRAFMKSGNSFAKSNQLAVEEILGKKSSELITEPNNILALEYLKRILYYRKNGHNIKAIAVKRYGSGYFDADDNTGFAGASYVRKLTEYKEIKCFVPENVAKIMEKDTAYGKACRYKEDIYFQLIRSQLVRSSAEELTGIFCMGEGLENKFKKEIINAENLEQLISSMVSRRYTEAAIRRLLIYVLLGVKKQEMTAGIYGRVLAANSRGQELLRTIKKQELNRIPLITNINKETELSEEILAALHYDMLASDMYNIINGRDLYAFSDKVVMPYMEQKMVKPLKQNA